MVVHQQPMSPALTGGRVTVRLFARLADIIGGRAIALEVDDRLTAHDAYLRLCHRFPELVAYGGKLLFAVNAEYCAPDRVLREGDELTLIPAVGVGGIG
jgi:molybdopterin converting factor small subunit